MLSAVQEHKSSYLQVVAIIALLLSAVFGFLFFSSLHAVHAQGSFEANCVGDEKALQASCNQDKNSR